VPKKSADRWLVPTHSDQCVQNPASSGGLGMSKENITRGAKQIIGKVVVSEPDPRKIGRRVWEIGWGQSVPSGMYGICNY